MTSGAVGGGMTSSSTTTSAASSSNNSQQPQSSASGSGQNSDGSKTTSNGNSSTHTASSGNNSSGKNQSRSAVYLRVYDISGGAAKMWSPIVLGRKVDGVWHSGVEVFGYEYFYGGGIVKMLPDNVEDTFGISPTRIHHLGYTSLMRNQFEKHLIAIMPMFSREVYDLVNWNCNHFSEHATRHLVDRGIPSYILDLPHEICKTFMGKIVLNFFKMLQGGSAPVTVDDPQHPSRLLNKSKSRLGPRRNSCPPTPSATSGNKDNGFSSGDGAPAPVAPPRLLGKSDFFAIDTASNLAGVVNGCTKTGTSVRSTQRRRTHASGTTASGSTAAAAAAAAIDAKNVKGGAAQSTGVRGQGVTFRATLGPDTGSQQQHHYRQKESGYSSVLFDENVKTIMGGKLQDTTDTHLVFSPRHKRLYEMERDKYVHRVPNHHQNNYYHQHRNTLEGIHHPPSTNSVRRVSHGGRNVPASTRRAVVGTRSFSVGPKQHRHAPSVR